MGDSTPLPSDLPAIQALIDAWIKQRGRYWSPLSQYARLAEEVGELGRELNFRFGDKPRTQKDASGSLTDELGDDLGIDLVTALSNTLRKYEKRV